MATNHTANYELSQWLSTDQVLRTDFNADNVKLDAALKDLGDQVVQKASQSAVDTLTTAVSQKAEQSALTAAVSTIPKIAVGTYTGNDNGSRSFSVGFTPKAVYVCVACGLAYTTNAEGYVYGGLAVTGGPVQHKGYAAVEITTGGFTVYQRDLGDYSGIYCNNSGMQYRYLAVG